MTMLDIAQSGSDLRPPVDGPRLRRLVDPTRRTARLPLAWSPAGVHDVPCLFAVRYAGSAWRLEGEGLEPVIFAQGGDAERQGRRVARGLARLGRDAKVNVYDARGRLVGALCFYARAGATPAPADRACPDMDKGAPH